MSGPVVACIAAILSIGASGMIAQTTLLRELLSQFSGSEFHIGLIIGNWIAAEALGAFVAGRFLKNPALVFPRYIRLTLLFSLLFPAMLFLARSWRVFAFLPPHEAISIGPMLAVSIIFVLPLAFIHGSQFVLAASFPGELIGNSSDAPGMVYGVETVGTVIGGASASFLLIPLLTPFQSAALLLLVNGIICLCLGKAAPERMARPGWGLLLFPLLAAAILFSGGAAVLERASLRLQWHGDPLVEARNTPYQNIAVIRNEDQFTFYTDGMPLLSLPDPDIARIEESAHLPLLAHPHPRRVLLLGGGAGGLLAEILKHPTVERIDYLELDPALVQTIEKYASQSARKELHDPRINIHLQDGRAFLRKSGQRYDVILVNMPLPLNLQGNRYFTTEFFALVKLALEPDGLVAAGATGSLSYYGEELRALTRSLLETVRSSLPHILILPGERNLFIASAALPVESLTAAELAGRLEARKVSTALITSPHLQWLFNSYQLQWFKQNIGEGGSINSDFLPYLLVRHVFYRTAQFNPGMKPLLELLGRIRIIHVALLLLLATGAVALLSGRRVRTAIIWTMATTGFTAMLLELSFFCIFQLFQGVMLRTIGLLIAIFMTGLWGGSRITSHPAPSAGEELKRLFAGDGILLLLSAALWVIASGAVIPAASSPAMLNMILLPLIFLAGFAAGLQFPPATRLTADQAGPGTALVYGFDLLGGWLGGLVGGALLLPLLGFAATAQLLLLLKSGSILCLYLQGKMVKM